VAKEVVKRQHVTGSQSLKRAFNLQVVKFIVISHDFDEKIQYKYPNLATAQKIIEQ
jgi:hypothetical protein